MNDSLLNLLPSNFLEKDTLSRVLTDSSNADTSGKFRQYRWRDAQVVYNTVNSEKNYLQINKGSKDGIRDNMGVFNSDGSLVGKVINSSSNYSVAMSLLHVENSVNVLVKKTRSSGTIKWDAKNPRFLTLTGIPKSDSLVKGDTIVTGHFSLSYPPGYIVGTVEQITKDPSSNFYILTVRTAANFSDLQQVMIAENMEYSKQSQLLEQTRKKVEQGQNQ